MQRWVKIPIVMWTVKIWWLRVHWQRCSGMRLTVAKLSVCVFQLKKKSPTSSNASNFPRQSRPPISSYVYPTNCPSRLIISCMWFVLHRNFAINLCSIDCDNLLRKATQSRRFFSQRTKVIASWISFACAIEFLNEIVADLQHLVAKRLALAIWKSILCKSDERIRGQSDDLIVFYIMMRENMLSKRQ